MLFGMMVGAVAVIVILVLLARYGARVEQNAANTRLGRLAIEQYQNGQENSDN